ncbi:MAG TPA: nicotinate phosphoribosyltransferase [Methylomirabilota bacterium]|nr:nicotinate phosphoribosyltransferase [Methylomirabilota bacterium]
MKPGSPYSGLLTDLYELTMAAGYFEADFQGKATFELFARSLPKRRNFLVAAGLEQCVEYLEHIQFTDDDIRYLRGHRDFWGLDDAFFDYLARFRFSGDVWAMPEGTICFPDEPLLRITAPIIEAQIVETYLLSSMSFQTLIASKAARATLAAQGRGVMEFGTRRAHGPESGVLAARAAFIGGCRGTSNVAAGYRFGIPTFGTQAHSWIMAHEDEEEAFRQFLDIFPDNSVLLLDTYEVRAAVEKIIAIRRKPHGVRLDSGDLAADSKWIRRRLDEVGWSDVQIFASGDLDEDRIESLVASGAKIDAFGVGTALSTSLDAPALGVIYKLVEVAADGTVRNSAKFSKAKITYPGRKQVFRRLDSRGRFVEDIIALEDEHIAGALPLLESVMKAGGRTAPSPHLTEAQARCLLQVAGLPEGLRRLAQAPAYAVQHSERLEELLSEVRRRVDKAARI